MKVFYVAVLVAILLLVSPEARSEFSWDHPGAAPFITKQQLLSPAIVRAKLAEARQAAVAMTSLSPEAAAHFEVVGVALLVHHQVPRGCGRSSLSPGLRAELMASKKTFIKRMVVGSWAGQPGADNGGWLCWRHNSVTNSEEYEFIPDPCDNVIVIVMVNGVCIIYRVA